MALPPGVVWDCSCRIVSNSNAADTDSVSPILSSAWASPSAVTVTDGDDAKVDEVVAMAELIRVETRAYSIRHSIRRVETFNQEVRAAYT
jgi:hypothetical protein